jgi:hypothetical protein
MVIIFSIIFIKKPLFLSYFLGEKQHDLWIMAVKTQNLEEEKKNHANYAKTIPRCSAFDGGFSFGDVDDYWRFIQHDGCGAFADEYSVSGTKRGAKCRFYRTSTVYV